MKTGLFLTSVCSLSAAASAWTPAATPTSTSSSRRSFLDQAAKLVPLVSVAVIGSSSPAFADDEPAVDAAVPVVTEAIPEVAEAVAAPEEATATETTTTTTAAYDENDFVARLKAQSDANRDKYKAEAQRPDKLSKRQFRSQYDRPSYIGVRNTHDENVRMVLKAELEQLVSDGKVTKSYESKVNKRSGEISDDYSKPIFVFVN